MRPLRRAGHLEEVSAARSEAALDLFDERLTGCQVGLLLERRSCVGQALKWSITLYSARPFKKGQIFTGI